MIKKYKLNKSELTRLKQEAKIYSQFLPVLKLKQEQLQIENIRIKKKYLYLKNVYIDMKNKIIKNIAIITDDKNKYNIKNYVLPNKIILQYKSLAGISIPILNDVIFPRNSVNLFDTQYWVSFMIKDLKQLIVKHIELKVVYQQYILIKKELKKATQKVNLFDKVLIPETKKAIKKINIVIGDEQVAAVGRAKIAKNKNVVIL
jgi:V/A-type H+-transporting ATPase subunit D